MVLPASGKRRLGNSSTEIQNALGPFTPCATDTIVICLSHLVVMGLCMYRIWITQKNSKAQKYCLRSCYYNYFLACLAGCSAAEPLFRLIMDGLAGLAPYEVLSLIVEVLAWLWMLVMIAIETKVYVREFRWFVRFGVIYALVGDAVMLSLVLYVKEHYNRDCSEFFYSSTFLVWILTRDILP
ncbi:ABC transporter C family member 2-like [Amaranthus tricolor]|uniref:ABC transporter C family member 2-like n=1 Tax=Amaranthus tricolor TaxID=29722 RepID=UPI00258E4AB8|nr:ABC transporter C family member 2-like [Amaranthus tricolor]